MITVWLQTISGFLSQFEQTGLTDHFMPILAGYPIIKRIRRLVNALNEISDKLL